MVGIQQEEEVRMVIDLRRKQFRIEYWNIGPKNYIFETRRHQSIIRAREHTGKPQSKIIKRMSKSL